MAVDPRFLINLKGKDFILLGGLLDMAHKGGLRSIETQVVRELSNPETDFWVFQAIGRFRTGEGDDAVWSAYGDAGPSSSQMRGAYLRHAETRAIARMLRMATNCAVTAFEELGPQGDDSNDDPLPAPPRDHSQVRRVSSPPAGAPPATPLPVARHSPGTVGPPPSPGRPAAGPVVVAEGGTVCDDCGQPVARNPALISQHKFNRFLCVRCQRTAATEAHTRVQSTEAPA